MTQLLDTIKFAGKNQNRGFRIADAIVDRPTWVAAIDAANHIEIPVSDPDRRILTQLDINERSWLQLGDYRFELVAVRKENRVGRLTLVYEDAIVAKLRRQTKRLSIPAGTLSRGGIAAKLANEANVDAAIDPGHRERVRDAVERSVGQEDTSSWDLLGTLVDEINWRRFSDGRRLVVGSDDWLLKRDDDVTRIRENTGPFYGIAWDLDVGKRVPEAYVDADFTRMALKPGEAVTLVGEGPADGRWLVAQIERPLHSTRGTIRLTRRRHELDEPQPTGVPDRGEDGFLPGLDGGADSPAAAANPSRTRMVNWALAQVGKAYVWGASGPNAFDCSGLVQEATRAGGRVLAKPSDNQWATLASTGSAVSLATAIATRGALLHRDGHIAISLGNGSTVEAMGTAYGVCLGKAAGRFVHGGIWL